MKGLEQSCFGPLAANCAGSRRLRPRAAKGPIIITMAASFAPSQARPSYWPSSFR